MKKISIRTVNAVNNRLTVEFDFSEELAPYFRSRKFEAEYRMDGRAMDITRVPQGILVIPFVCNVLPVVWLADAVLELEELDADFAQSIDQFKQGFIDMYPDCSFLGKLEIGAVNAYPMARENQAAAFFSGGVDAYCTLLEHLRERPCLIALWGADIPYEDAQGWQVLYSQLSAEAEALKLPLCSVHSNFREFIDAAGLDASFRPLIHDSWWHGVQHGIGLIGHAAPLSYLYGIKTLYIAASYCKEVYHTCASDPSIDNFVRFCGTQTVHDCFISRQNKIRIIIEKKKTENIPVHLHVCWKTTDGNNCCLCEKCIRTIMAFWAEGENPADYGFSSDPSVYRKCVRLCKTSLIYDEIVLPLWKNIQQAAVQNRQTIRASGYEQYIGWIYDADFEKMNLDIHRKLNALRKRVASKLGRILRGR